MYFLKSLDETLGALGAPPPAAGAVPTPEELHDSAAPGKTHRRLQLFAVAAVALCERAAAAEAVGKAEAATQAVAEAAEAKAKEAETERAQEVAAAAANAEKDKARGELAAAEKKVADAAGGAPQANIQNLASQWPLLAGLPDE